jgi:ubiquinone/menaquinone biosynthesis C-methylase UbiE
VALDLACGTGIVSKSLVDVLNDKQKANLELTCADNADSMLDYVGPRIREFGLKSAEAVKVDARDTKLPSNKFTHVLLNFGPMIFSDGPAGIRELYRLLQPNGTLAMSSWKVVGWVGDVKAAFASDPELPAFPTEEALRRILNMGGIWDDQEWLRDNVTKAGFVDVNVVDLPHTSTMTTVEEFGRLMAGMVGLIQQTVWTQEQRDKYKDRVYDVVLSYMRNKYSDKEIKWDWVAIVTTGRKPA